MAEQDQKDTYQPDKKDYEILRLLESDAKLTVRELAQKVNLSPSPTHERIKRLEKHGIIKQYGALLDNRRIGREIMVICQVSLKDHSKTAGQQFIDAVNSFPEVIECYNIAGDFDFMLKIVTQSMESYHRFYVDKLTDGTGVGQTKSTFVMDVIKQTHILL